MTDKQIIIDGVDVSGCAHRCDTHKTLLADGHIKEFENYCQITNDGCYAINCYYKQLKRKEQECEELKKIIDEAKNSKLDLKSFLVGEAVQNEYEQQLDQLKQTLAEIKEIAETFLTHCMGWRCDAMDDILQKISECEGNDG